MQFEVLYVTAMQEVNVQVAVRVGVHYVQQVCSISRTDLFIHKVTFYMPMYSVLCFLSPEAAYGFVIRQIWVFNFDLV